MAGFDLTPPSSSLSVCVSPLLLQPRRLMAIFKTIIDKERRAAVQAAKAAEKEAAEAAAMDDDEDDDEESD